MMLFLFAQDVENENRVELTEVSIDEILELQQEEQQARKQSEDLKKRAMQERGLICHTDPIQDDFFWQLYSRSASRWWVLAVSDHRECSQTSQCWSKVDEERENIFTQAVLLESSNTRFERWSVGSDLSVDIVYEGSKVFEFLFYFVSHESELQSFQPSL